MAGDAGPRLRSVPVGPPPSVYGDDDAPQMAYDASASVAAADMVNRRSLARTAHISACNICTVVVLSQLRELGPCLHACPTRGYVSVLNLKVLMDAQSQRQYVTPFDSLRSRLDQLTARRQALDQGVDVQESNLDHSMSRDE